MPYFVYVLKDDKGNFYKGVTSDLDRRVKQHRGGHTRSTMRMKNIEVVYSEKFDKFEMARRRELYFKSAAGRRYLKKKLKI